MRALRKLQSDFADTILSGSELGLVNDIRQSPIAPERRVQIYRNHFLITLVECLGITFPTLKALVGDAFLAQAARRFAAAFPPTSPVLFEYGDAFPRFLAEAAGAEFAYLEDVGALEWAINHAYHADDTRPVDTSALLQVTAERRGDVILALHPSARLIASIYPVLDIWRSHQSGGEQNAIDLSQGGVRLLVWRNDIDVVWQILTPATEAFIQALLGRATLAQACAAALEIEPSFDAGVALKDLFAGATVVGVSVAEPSTPAP